MELSALRTMARRRISRDLTSSGWPDSEVDAAINDWYRRVYAWVMDAAGLYEQNESILTEDLQTNVAGYQFDLTQLLAINRVEVRYSVNDRYVAATRIDDQETREGFQSGVISEATQANPRYRLAGDIIHVHPVPTEDVLNGLAVSITDDLTDMAASDDVPIINPLVHQILAIGAAYNFLIADRQRLTANQLWHEIHGNGGDDPNSLKYSLECLVRNFDRNLRQRFVPRKQSFR